MKETPRTSNPVPFLVRGCQYRAIILGSPFDFWVPRTLGRSEAREAAIEFAGPEYYTDSDIDSVRKLKF